jgi:hypothetical protein
MKKVIPSVFFFSLLVFSLWVDQSFNSQGVQSSLKLLELIPEGISRVELQEVVITKAKEQWLFSNTTGLINQRDIDQFIENFQWVEVIQEVTNSEFDQDFLVQLNDEKYIFSKIYNETGNFLVKVQGPEKTHVYLCYSSKPFEGFYKDEVDFKKITYRLLKENISHWGYFIKTKFLNGQSSFKRFKNNELEVEINWQENRVTLQKDQYPFGIDPNALKSFSELIKRLEFLELDDDAPRKKSGFSIEVQGVQFDLAHDQFNFYLLKDNLSFLVKGIEELLVPPNYFWNKSYSRVEELLQRDGRISLYVENRVKYQFEIANKQIFGLDSVSNSKLKAFKEVLCYLTYCNEKYAFLDVKEKLEDENFDFALDFFGQYKVYFKVNGTLLEIWDPKLKVKTQYIWSLFREKESF